MTITRSPGIPIGLGYVAGGGHTGATADLDDTVAEAARLLADAYGMDVTIRFNSDRRSGGAFLRTHEVDGIGANAEIGICAQLHYTHEERRLRFPLTFDEEEMADFPNGGMTIYAHISEASVKPGVLREGERYVHRPMDSVADALAFVLANGQLNA